MQNIISIDHHLCQGCGACALVCPADAVRIVEPPQEELLDSLRTTLVRAAWDPPFPPTLLISDLDPAVSNTPPAKGEAGHGYRVHFEVEQIARVRLELLLAALAHGAGAVIVSCGPQDPPKIQEAVKSEVRMARAVLRGIGLPEEKCRFAPVGPGGIDSERGTPASSGLDAQASPPAMARTKCSPGEARWINRQALVRQLAQHLYDQSGAREPSLELPVGSPFGTISIDVASCTACMACVAACPSGALSTSGDVPGLMFQESRCHQCGLCKETCPEGAIRLVPRLFCDPEGVEVQRVLHEAQPLRCIECGVPFASRAMIDRIRNKLTGHWMYAGERQLRRLQMCRTCSARDALASKEMQSWNLQ